MQSAVRENAGSPVGAGSAPNLMTSPVQRSTPDKKNPPVVPEDKKKGIAGPAIGPAMAICPECGAEIGRELIHAGPKLFVLPLPRTCPVCDAWITPKVRPAPDRDQSKLPGVA